MAIGCLLALALSNAVALVVLARLADTRDTEGLVRRVDQLQHLRLQVARAVMPLNDYLISPNPAYLDAWRREEAALRTQLEASSAQLLPDAAAQLEARLAELSSRGQRLAALETAPARALDREDLMEAFDAAGERMVADIDGSLRALNAEFDRDWAREDTLRRWASLIVLGIGALNAIGLGLMLGIGRSINRRVHRLLVATRRLIKGGEPISAAAPEVNQADELGELARSIDTVRATRDEVVRTERLAAIGELAIAMRHEINNPLQAITLLTEGIAERAREGGDARQLEPCALLQEACLELHDRVQKLTAVLDRPSVRYHGQAQMKDIHGSSDAPPAAVPQPADK